MRTGSVHVTPVNGVGDGHHSVPAPKFGEKLFRYPPLTHGLRVPVRFQFILLTVPGSRARRISFKMFQIGRSRPREVE